MDPLARDGQAAGLRAAVELVRHAEELGGERGPGLKYMASGVPAWTTWPAFIRTTVSAIARASSWSWVT